MMVSWMGHSVQGFRIVNFIIQSTYLILHFLFILVLYRRRQPTPVFLCGRLFMDLGFRSFHGNHCVHFLSREQQSLCVCCKLSVYREHDCGGILCHLDPVPLRHGSACLRSPVSYFSLSLPGNYLHFGVYQRNAPSFLYKADHGRACKPRSHVYSLSYMAVPDSVFGICHFFKVCMEIRKRSRETDFHVFSVSPAACSRRADPFDQWG